MGWHFAVWVSVSIFCVVTRLRFLLSHHSHIIHAAYTGGNTDWQHGSGVFSAAGVLAADCNNTSNINNHILVRGAQRETQSRDGLGKADDGVGRKGGRNKFSRAGIRVVTAEFQLQQHGNRSCLLNLAKLMNIWIQFRSSGIHRVLFAQDLAQTGVIHPLNVWTREHNRRLGTLGRWWTHNDLTLAIYLAVCAPGI